MKTWYGIHTASAYTQICERSNLYKTTLETLLESSDDDDIKDTTNSVKRKCLKCDKTFESDGIGNRICPRCILGNQKIYS